MMSTDNQKQTSLQAAFLEFQAQRKDQKRRAIRNAAIPKRSQQALDELREKFANACFSYLGIPYSRRYHQTPDCTHYDAPLYLDCCGLVRQAMRDLKEEFGFELGRWNQAYQYDVLGDEIPFEQAKRGDLVFIKADYFNPKAKAQKHRLVHVEVLTGDGEKTIGARHQHGVIQVHDSYKFESKNYGNMTYHIKSIRPWLQGVCKSTCEEHEWKHVDGKSVKGSLFELQDQGEEAE